MIPLSHGRHLFGDDPASYATARPPYPEALYERLIERCGLEPGTSVFEIGAGTGLATRRLLELGANPLVAVEPDSRFAAYLRQDLAGLDVREAPFEDVDLGLAGFDLGVAATSFHWLDQPTSLAKVKEVLKPGGWWAMFWTNFGGEQDAPLREATAHLFKKTKSSPSMGGEGKPPFAMDVEARLADLAAAGFEDAEYETWSWTAPLKTPKLIQLYWTYSTVQSLPPDEKEWLLAGMTEIVDRDFGGVIEQPYAVALYTARRP